MFEYLALVSGATVIDLTDGISYDLVSYAPVVAPLNDNQLGPLYADTEESITFHAIGCTAAEAYAAARAVNTLLDQARRWAQGENPSSAPPVLLRLKAQGSELDPLDVAVLGRADGGPPNLALPATWDAHAERYVIQGITIQSVRRGQLLADEETTAASSAANNPVIQTRTFADDLDGFHPTELRIGSFTAQKATSIAPSVILWAPAANYLTLDDCLSGAVTSIFVATNDAAQLPYGGTQTLRYTPADTSTQSTAPGASLVSPGALTVNSPYSDGLGQAAIWLVLRNNSTTTTFRVSATIDGWGMRATTPEVAIDASTQQPRIVFLGIVSLIGGGNMFGAPGLRFNVTASAASGSIDLDHYVVQVLDSAASGAVTYGPATLQNQFGSSLTAVELRVDPAWLERPSAIVGAIAPSTGETIGASYAGDPRAYSTGNEIAVLWLATRSTFWRYVDHTNAALQVTLAAIRRRAYLVPE